MRPKTKFNRGTVELGAYQEKGKFDPYKIKDYEIAQLQKNQEIEKANYMRRAEEGKQNMDLRFKQELLELEIANEYQRLKDDRAYNELNMLVESGQQLVMQGVKWAKEGQANRAKADFKKLPKVEQAKREQEWLRLVEKQNLNNRTVEEVVQELEAQGISNPFAEAIRGKGKVYAATYMELAAVNYAGHVPRLMDKALRERAFDTGVVDSQGKPVLRKWTELTDKERSGPMGAAFLAEAGAFTEGILGKDLPPEVIGPTIGSAIKKYTDKFAVDQSAIYASQLQKDTQQSIKAITLGIFKRANVADPNYSDSFNNGAAMEAFRSYMPAGTTDKEIRQHIIRELTKEIITNPKGEFAQLGLKWLSSDVTIDGQKTTRMFKMKKILEDTGFWQAYEAAHISQKLEGSQKAKRVILQKHLQMQSGELKDLKGIQEDIFEWYGTVDEESGLTNKERLGGMPLELVVSVLTSDNPSVSDGPQEALIDELVGLSIHNGGTIKPSTARFFGANNATIAALQERGIVQTKETTPEGDTKLEGIAKKITNGLYKSAVGSAQQNGQWALTNRHVTRLLKRSVEEYKKSMTPDDAVDRAIADMEILAETEAGKQQLIYDAAEVTYNFTPENKATEIASEILRVSKAKGISTLEALKNGELQSLNPILSKYLDMMKEKNMTASQIRKAIAIDPILNSATWQNKIGLNPSTVVDWHLRRLGFENGIPDPGEEWRGLAAQVAPEVAEKVKANNTTFKILCTQNCQSEEDYNQLNENLGLNKKINPEDAKQLGKTFERINQVSSKLERPWDSNLRYLTDSESINVDIDNVRNNYGLSEGYNLNKTHPNVIRSLPALANAYRIYLEENNLPIPEGGLLSAIVPPTDWLGTDHGDTKLGRTRLQVKDGEFAKWVLDNGARFGYKVEDASERPLARKAIKGPFDTFFGGKAIGEGPDGLLTPAATEFFNPGIIMTYTGSNGMGLTVPDTSLTGDLVEGIGYRTHHTLNAGNRKQILNRTFRAYGPTVFMYDGVPFSQLPIERQSELLTEWEKVRLTAHSEPK